MADGDLFFCFCSNYRFDFFITNLPRLQPEDEDRFDIFIAGGGVSCNHDHSVFQLGHQR